MHPQKYFPPIQFFKAVQTEMTVFLVARTRARILLQHQPPVVQAEDHQGEVPGDQGGGGVHQCQKTVPVHQPTLEVDQFVSRTSKVERCQGTTKVLEVEVFIKDRKQLLLSSLLNVHHLNCASWLLSLKRVHLTRGHSGKKGRSNQ